MEEHPRRSALHCVGGDGLGGADSWRWLSGKLEAHAFEEELQLGLRLGVASEQKFAPVGGGDAHIDHLHGGKFLQRAAAGETRSEALQLSPERKKYARKEMKTCASMLSIL
jgi:hypothetical protein